MRQGDGRVRYSPRMGDSPAEILRDVHTIGRIGAVPMVLRIVSESTGMGFAAVARVTDGTWTACAVHDTIAFNLQPGGQLDVSTTLCKEVRAALTPIAIDHASLDAIYCNHHTPRTYAIESYISVPIVLSDGQYFGNLCAIDPKPARVANPATVAMFTSFAQLIALQLEAERRSEAEQAALLDERAQGELREQFIAVLGHDLRTPLAALSACGTLLQRQADQPAQVRTLAERIVRNSRRMGTLIDNTLDLARARLGGGIDIRPVDVADIGLPLRAVVAELRDAQPGRAIVADIDVASPVHCDPGRVQQLAANLLGNALVHGSADGAVRLGVREEDGELVVRVHNEGDPIAATSLASIFQPFRRGTGASNREGLGLGLYICAQIAQAHGGRLEVSSSAESGTTFTARLPM